MAPIGEEDPATLPRQALYNPGQTGRVITLWVATPTMSAVLSFLLFELILRS